MATTRRGQLPVQVNDSENELPVGGAKGFINGKAGQQPPQDRRNALGMIRQDDNIQRILVDKKPHVDKKVKIEDENNTRKQLLVPLTKQIQSQVLSQQEVPRKGIETRLGFSILCDESFEEEEEDLFNDQSLRIDNASETSSQVKRKIEDPDSLNDSTTDLFAFVDVNDRSDQGRVLRDITRETSMSVMTDDDDCGLVTSGFDLSMDKSGCVSMVSTQEDLMGDLDSLYFSQEYRQEILEYLVKLEMKNQPDHDYMTRQPDINYKMRSILVDWMVDVTEEYKLQEESIFLAVAFIDRFLSHMTIARQHFQLLGSASLFISSKYEEIYPPDVKEFVSITDDSYSKGQVLNMEMLILKTLKMKLSSPTSHYFLRMFLSYIKSSSQVGCLSEYLCFLTMLEGETFMKFLPSEIAMSSLLLSTYAYSEEEALQVRDFLPETLAIMDSQHASDMSFKTKDRINECVILLSNSYVNAHRHAQQAIYTKYSCSKYFSVSSMGIIYSMDGKVLLK